LNRYLVSYQNVLKIIPYLLENDYHVVDIGVVKHIILSIKDLRNKHAHQKFIARDCYLLTELSLRFFENIVGNQFRE
jgi:hypothetical protein